MREKCIVWGAGNYGKRLVKTLSAENEYEVVAFCDRNVQLVGRKIDGYDVISIEDAIERCGMDKEMVMIIGLFDYGAIEDMKQDMRVRFPVDTRVVVGHSIQDQAENRMLKEFAHNRDFRWKVDLEKYFLEWLDNLMSEVEYWVEEVANTRGRRNIYNRKCRRNHIFAHHGIAEKVNGGEIVLDVGCGLISRFGEVLEDGSTIQLIPVDALAHFYNIINQQISDGLKKDYICRFGLFEFLGNSFGQEFADYIIVDNALDHCIDPWRSLVECLYVLKTGGYMYLNHRRAEAVYEDWVGLHKWNIDCHQGDFIIWNKENAINVTEKLSGFAEIQVNFDEGISEREEQKVDISILKKRDFSIDDFFNRSKETDILARCIDKLMERWASDSKKFYLMLDQVQL